MDIPYQSASIDIWDKKYRLKDIDGSNIDESMEDTYKRVAKSLSDVELTDKAKWYDEFLWALHEGAIPAGRIISNAGAKDYKPSTSTINCAVSGTIEDSMDGILNKLHEAGMTLKAGCGIGYEFSTLRPKGGYVNGAGAYTSGPLSFMDIYDKMCFTVSSAGGRRGAQMVTFDIRHPDTLEFIKAKREDGRLRQFNLSLLITDEFMEAVKNDDEWSFSFPISKTELDKADIKSSDIIWRDFPTTDGYITSSKAGIYFGEESNSYITSSEAEIYFGEEDGSLVVSNPNLVACKKWGSIKARELWNIIMSSTYDYAEPGFILIDKVNKYNNNWFCEDIRATNPCGEQPLPPYGSCLLGSINLTKFVKRPFTEHAEFDWKKYSRVIRIFTRMLDNVVEINGLPLGNQRHEIEYKRRHGMGFLGLGSAMTMLGIKYGSKESLVFTDKVSKMLAIEGWITGLELANEKGAAPIMDDDFFITEELASKNPKILKEYSIGDRVTGSELFVLSEYMQTLRDEGYYALVNDIKKYGCRFTHHSSIAPTGTISLSLANNASNGIEPSFAHHYSRNVIREGKKSKEKVDVFSYELLAYRELVNKNAMPFSDNKDETLPDYFISSETIEPINHIDIQAAAQKWIDSSISKTVNIPTDFDYDKFKDVYLYAYDKGLKGCTTFRFNPEAFQGVLVKEDDLDNTLYKFVLDNGDEVVYKGSDKVVYDGEEHTAANLFDALKEGYYGKF